MRNQYMTTSKKPEVHDVLICRQSRTEPQLQVTRRRAKFSREVWTLLLRYASGRSHVHARIPPAVSLERVEHGPVLAGQKQSPTDTGQEVVSHHVTDRK